MPLRTFRSTYRDPRGKVRDWEHAERSTRPKSSEIDGVGIVAVIQKATGMQRHVEETTLR